MTGGGNTKLVWLNWHRKIALLITIPALLILSTGSLLQLKAWIPWLQPKTYSGSEKIPKLSFQTILEISQTVPQAEVRTWSDITNVDVRPEKGIIRVRTNNHYEIQLDASTGQILNAGPRRVSTLIALHEGSWFGPSIRNGIFLPTAFLFLSLWGTGTYLLLPYFKKNIFPLKGNSNVRR